MRGVVISILLFSCTCIPAFSQFELGVQLGVNYGIVKDNFVGTFEPFHNMFSYKGGLNVKYSINEKYSLTSGFYYSQRGGSVDSRFAEKKDKLYWNFFEVPIVANRNLFSNFSFGIGFVFSRLDATAIHTMDEKLYNIDFTTNFNFRFLNRFSLETSYSFGALKTYFNKSESYYFSLGNVSLGYRFYKSK